MRLATKIDPISRDVEAIIAEDLSPVARSRALAAFAREQLDEAQETNRRALGRVPPHDTFVDRRPGAPIDSVKPDGIVEFEFDLLLDLFRWVHAQLVQHSPRRSGAYAASHLFFADGVQASPDLAVPAAREYVFVSTAPYARKIERGLSSQAPDGVYEAVATLAARGFGNVARIRFAYREPLAGGIQAWADARSGGARRSRGYQRDIRQPAVVITVG